YSGFTLAARYPYYTGIRAEHQALGFPVPSKVIEKIPSDKKVYLGQIVSLYSAINGAKKDGIPYIRGPSSVEIVVRNE
ncbi:MAG: hypothetical protein QXI19_10245, partial [Candidatus Caldarchaeum sp.]